MNEQQGDKAIEQEAEMAFPFFDNGDPDYIEKINSIRKLQRIAYKIASTKYTESLKQKDEDAKKAWEWSEKLAANNDDLKKQIASLQSELERLKDVLHTERTGLAKALENINKAVESRRWATESRGPYEYNDKEFYKEMEYLVDEIADLSMNALRESGKLAHAECCGRGERVRLFSIQQIEQAFDEWDNNDSIDIPFTEYLLLKASKEGAPETGGPSINQTK